MKIICVLLVVAALLCISGPPPARLYGVLQPKAQYLSSTRAAWNTAYIQTVKAEYQQIVDAGTPTPTLASSTSARLYGVLQPKAQYLSSTRAAGVQARTLELDWNLYEPQAGVWNTAYIQAVKAEYQQMVAAGYQVVLDFGMQYPPAWASAIRPWRDQYGNTYDGAVNAVWSPVVRQHMASYIQRVFQDLGTGFYGVRLGSGGFVETLYPDSAPGFQFSYWAFDADALTSNPVPAWRPGQASPHGEARTFYTWYLQHLIDTVNWQQAVVRQHYGGYLIQLLPGQGLRPAQWDTLLATNLTPYDQDLYDAERGAVWDKLVDGMHNRTQVMIDCSSVGDASASSPYVNEASADPLDWSSAHWVAYNADRYGLPKMAENPGSDSAANMHVVFAQLTTYGYTSLFWAFEPQLYSGGYATIDDYKTLIMKHR